MPSSACGYTKTVSHCLPLNGRMQTWESWDNFDWGESQEKAFMDIKKALLSSAALGLPDLTEPFDKLTLGQPLTIYAQAATGPLAHQCQDDPLPDSVAGQGPNSLRGSGDPEPRLTTSTSGGSRDS